MIIFLKLIKRTPPTYAALITLYNAIDQVYGDKVRRYTADELKTLKEDKINVFLTERGNNGNQ